MGYLTSSSSLSSVCGVLGLFVCLFFVYGMRRGGSVDVDDVG